MKLFSIWYHGKAILKKYFFKLIYGKKLIIGSKTTWRRNFSLLIGNKANIIIGHDCFFNNDCSLVSMDEIKIGNGTIFGENVKIYDNNHRFNKVSIPIKKQGYSIGSISIGNHCWIGSNVIILKGVHIGDNFVIGAGCVVSKSLSANTILKISDKNYIRLKMIAK